MAQTQDEYHTAGNEADGITVDYKKKYGEQLQAIKDNYRTIDIAYNVEDNDDYVNGRSFCCNDGSLNKNVNMEDLALQVLKEFKNNGLHTATKKDKVWTVNKTKLSNEKYKQLQSLFNSLNENGRTPMEQRNADAKAKQELETLQQTWGTMR